MKKAKKEVFVNPINGKKHRTWEAMHKSIAKEIKPYPVRRDYYDAIAGWGRQTNALYSAPVIRATAVICVFRECLEAEYIEFDVKGRGAALNHALYGYDPAQGVAVVQARQALRRRKFGYLTTHKTYFLVGRNEITGEYFRHPVSAHAVRAAIRKNPDPAAAVRAVQRWMWEVSEKQLAQAVRQGDILLVPEKRVPDWTGGDALYHRLTVAESHEIRADEIRVNGRCYALNPTIVHTKGQHAPVAMEGWVSVRVARESDAWDFAVRVGD